jgi:hypothetical protein
MKDGGFLGVAEGAAIRTNFFAPNRIRGRTHDTHRASAAS